MYDLVKGDVSFGDLHLTYDFTHGLSREQYIKAEEAKMTGVYHLPDGRLIMPALRII
jgi:hypothetical protein